MDAVQGTQVRLDVTITNADTGLPVDPGLLTCRIENPAGTTTDQTLSTGVARLGPGLYRATMDTSPAAGTWPYEWIVEGGVSMVRDSVNVLALLPAPGQLPAGRPDVGRSVSDALRSLKRYVALALGDEWEVRLSREEGAFERPFCRVWQVAGSTYPLTGGKWLADIVQPFVISAYPAAGATPDEALMNAQAVEEQFFLAFRAGVADGHPMRVPLFNYNGVPLDQPGVWYPRAFMRVSDLSTQPFPDPDDNTLWTVACDVRLAWRRLAQTIPETSILQRFGIRPIGSMPPLPPPPGPAALVPVARSLSAATSTVGVSSHFLVPRAASAAAATATVSGGTSHVALSSMPVISRGLPAAASTDPGGIYAAANAVDDDYGSSWRSFTSPNGGTPQWLRIDVSSLDHSPSGQLSSVWFVWKGMPQSYFDGTSTLGSVVGSNILMLPRNYTVDAHPSSSAPAESDPGWVTLATATDNRYSAKIHGPFDLHAYNWVRIHVTASSGYTGANDDVVLQVQLRDVRSTRDDSIFVYGASVEQGGWSILEPGNAFYPVGFLGPAEHAIRHAAGRTDPPVVINGGMGGWVAATGAANLTDFIDGNPCKYVILAFGGNDANNANHAWVDETDPNAQDYKAQTQAIISHVLAAGKIPILSKIYWFDANTWCPGNGLIVNQMVDELVAANPGTLLGVDMYSFMQANPNLLIDHLHPTHDDTVPAGMLNGLTGYEQYLAHWAATLHALLY